MAVYTFTPLGFPTGGVFRNSARGINDAGLIVGSFTEGLFVTHGFLYNSLNGSYQLVDIPVAGTTTITLAGINDAGRIVGEASDSFGLYGFLKDGNAYSLIEGPGGLTSTRVTGINNLGWMVGWFPDNQGRVHGFLTGDRIHYNLIDVGPFNTFVMGTSYNPTKGLIYNVGFYIDGSGVHGFVNDFFSQITVTVDYPGATATYVSGINDAGQFVGTYEVATGFGRHGFFFDGANYISFDSPYGPISYQENTIPVFGINDSGQIVGSSYVSYTSGSGNTIGFLLTINAVQDFNGDRRSDILFSNFGPSFGSNYQWQVNDRAISSQGAVDLYDKAFTVQVVGDFNGDRQSDLIFENPNTGGVWEWRLNGTTIVSQGAVDVADPSYHLLGAADFDGNGTSDLLWRNDAGFIYEWQMKVQASTVSSNTPVFVQLLDPRWHVVGAGDFDADGKADLLLRNISNTSDNGAFYLWEMNGNVIKAQGGIERPGTDWQTLGVGDFDGNGKADFAVRHVGNFQPGESPGAVWVYLMDGTAIQSQGAAGIADATVWHLAGIGDYNGDGKDDILYRNDGGHFYSWDMNGTSIASEGAVPWADPSFKVVTQHWDVV